MVNGTIMLLEPIGSMKCGDLLQLDDKQSVYNLEYNWENLAQLNLDSRQFDPLEPLASLI